MREILFRGKRVDNGAWVYGYYVFDLQEEKPYIYHIHNHPCGNTLIPHEVTPETVGQYTGLTDMNGRKVFEGDIVKIEKYLYRVYFDTSMVCFKFCKICDNWDISFYKYADLSKIIGNIHDNPELLREVKGETR